MQKYTVEVFTGDCLNAGTTNTVFIKLVGTKGSSNPEKFGLLHSMLSHSQKTFTVCCRESLGALQFVELEFVSGLVQDDWFCHKVLVTQPGGDKLLFPSHQWLSRKNKLVLREATAKLRHKETETNALDHRIQTLKKRCEDFRWVEYDSEISYIVQADKPSSLPSEMQFSFTKENEFRRALFTALTELKLSNFSHVTNTWSSMEELKRIIKPSKTQDYIEKYWTTDEFFGYQFLNDLNPMMIKRCSKLSENFPVTNHMVKSFLPKESSLEKELEGGNIFLCDYARLDQIEGNNIDGKQQYVAAPLCLLYCRPDGKLKPVAIQLKQKPGQDNPIFLPTDSKHDWLLAKIFVRNSEFNEHQLNYHLLRTHLVAEVFTMATLRTLPPAHPLFKLLVPHTRYTLQINVMARKQLISTDGFFAKHSALGHKGLVKFLRRANSSLTYSSLCLPDNIKERGVENIPHYYYRDDGIELWNIIHNPRFVYGVVSHYYTDPDVEKDSELQTWLTEIREHGFPKNDKCGIPTSFHTVMEVVKFVTMLIFTVSAQHSAVNSGQYDFGAWMPNFPSTLKIPPPARKGQTTAESIIAALPDVTSTIRTIATAYLLSKKSSDHYPLGYYPEEYFSEAGPLQSMAEFRKDLKALESKIEERNKNLELPYSYLNPKNIDSSVDL